MSNAEKNLILRVAERLAELGTNAFAVERSAKLPADAVRSVLRGGKKSGTTLNRAQAICDALGLELYIGPPREALEPAKPPAGPDWERFAPDITLPQRGYAKCSVRGWGKEQPLSNPLPAPQALDDPQAFYVTASGQSMIPEGIRPNDTVLVTTSREPDIGERVWIIGHNGEASIKRLVGRSDQSITVRGWMPIQDGQQQSFEEELITKHLKALAPVIAVFEGRPGNKAVIHRPDPKVAAPEGVELDDFAIIHMHPLQRALDGSAVKAIPDGLAFPRAWLKHHGILASRSSLLAMDGDDMEPTFGSTSVVLINHRRTTIQHRRCYAFLQGDVMHIKRLEKLSDTQLLVVSDNPKHHSVLLHGDQLEEIEIVGEVVWAGQSF